VRADVTGSTGDQDAHERQPLNASNEDFLVGI